MRLEQNLRWKKNRWSERGRISDCGSNLEDLLRDNKTLTEEEKTNLDCALLFLNQIRVSLEKNKWRSRWDWLQKENEECNGE